MVVVVIADFAESALSAPAPHIVEKLEAHLHFLLFVSSLVLLLNLWGPESTMPGVEELLEEAYSSSTTLDETEREMEMWSKVDADETGIGIRGHCILGWYSSFSQRL